MNCFYYLLDLGVSLRCAPGGAARAVGHDTTVPDGAEPPALTDSGAFPTRSCVRAVFSALRARIPHATTAWTALGSLSALLTVCRALPSGARRYP